MAHSIGVTLWRAFYSKDTGVFNLQQVVVTDLHDDYCHIQRPDGQVVTECSRYLFAKQARAKAAVENYNTKLRKMLKKLRQQATAYRF